MSIGPITSAKLEENGYDPDKQAESNEIPGLIQAVIDLAHEDPFEGDFEE